MFTRSVRRQRGSVVAFAVLLTACGAEHGGNANGGGGLTNGGGGLTNGGGARAGNGGAGGSLADSYFGGQRGAGSNGSSMGDGDCMPNFTGSIRDFTPMHPDFESFGGQGATKGMVKDMLGADKKPVYALTGPFYDPVKAQGGAPMMGMQATGPDRFDQWYRDTDGVNMRFDYTFPLVQQPNGSLVFDSDAFFPIDGKGFGNFKDGHNFHFTTELHTTFAYNGGEVFSFKGDDDLWVFVNGRLALDLGGLHSRLDGTITLDDIAGTFGLKKGDTYPLDLFHAERHTNQSNFRVETTIKFNNCNPIIVP
jgi:fibro-slime domain-containing protein